MQIVTIYDDPTAALSTKASPIELNKQGFTEAKEIVAQLQDTLLPLMPAAGLAAPQIGIKKRVIIFSWDRSVEHLRAAINPSYTPMEEQSNISWEACFSSAPKEGPCQAALLSRCQKILATYYDFDGNKIQETMEGFAAKVFQHECDHLEGTVNVHKKPIETKEFASYEGFLDFMKTVKAKDSVSYIAPQVYKK